MTTTRSATFAATPVTRGRLADARRKGTTTYDLLAGIERPVRTKTKPKSKTTAKTTNHRSRRLLASFPPPVVVRLDKPTSEYVVAVRALCEDIERYHEELGVSLNVYRSPQPIHDIIMDRPTGRVFARIVQPRTLDLYRDGCERFRVGDLLSPSDEVLGNVFDLGNRD